MTSDTAACEHGPDCLSVTCHLDDEPTIAPAQLADAWFTERDHGGGTHSADCWQHHPGCAYMMGRREAALDIEAAAAGAARTSRDFGRGFMEAARVARRDDDPTSTGTYRDYAAEVVAQGKAAPEDQGLYNVIRTSLDYWWDFTTAEFILRDKGAADAYRDGLARRLLCDLRVARERGQIT